MTQHVSHYHSDQIRELHAEIERLTALVAQQSRKHDADMLVERLEIERLTAREEQRAERLRLYMNRIGELEADNERLRAALQEIADFPYVGTQASQKIWGIARRALEPADTATDE
jgi:hypothetical protein